MLQKFYYSTIRKSVIAFGNLFNNIHIDRKDSLDNVVQTLKVPLSYAPRQKFLARIDSLPIAEERSTQVLLRRMAFEMTNIAYDPSRRVSLVQQNRGVNLTSNTLNTQYAPTPYNIEMFLFAYVKNQDDGLQIVEQILPYFNPDFNLTLNTIPSLNIKNDMQIVLNTLNYEDQYEGDFVNRRAIIWTFNFTVKLNFYGPINKTGVITSVYADIFNNEDMSQKIQTYEVTIDPEGAQRGNVTSFIETFTDF